MGGEAIGLNYRSAAAGVRKCLPGHHAASRGAPPPCCNVGLWTKESKSGTSGRLPEPSCMPKSRSRTSERASRSKPLARPAAPSPAGAGLRTLRGPSVRNSKAPKKARKSPRSDPRRTRDSTPSRPSLIRLPQCLRRALQVTRPSTPDEQRVAQPVQIANRFGWDAFNSRERDAGPLRSPARRTANVQLRVSRLSPGSTNNRSAQAARSPGPSPFRAAPRPRP